MQVHLHKPTVELIAEADHVISYLHRHRDVGLTYSGDMTRRLVGYSDASWETRYSYVRLGYPVSSGLVLH